MPKGYLFISNGFKPTIDELENREPFKPNSFSLACLNVANELCLSLHMGINRNRPEEIKCLDYNISFYDQHSYRNIFALHDIYRAYKNCCQYLNLHPEIEIIHCNTPIGGVIGRLCGKKYNKKIIYTAHGFHFYNGAPLVNRTIFKWIEKRLAHYTDVLITINHEDFEAAKHFKLKNDGKVYYVPGVGIDTSEYQPQLSRKSITSELNIPEDAFICISVGNLDTNKNFDSLIKAFALLKDTKAVLLICGRGSQYNNLQSLINKLNLNKQVKLLGFRTDIKDLLSISDSFLLGSKREGLPRSTMEAMVAGLPCIVSDIRGNRDLIINSEGGYLIKPTDISGFANAVKSIINNPELALKMGSLNKQRVENFSIAAVERHLKTIFSELLQF